MAKIKVETNRICLSKLQDFKTKISDDLRKVHQFDGSLKDLKKSISTMDSEFREHLEKYPVDEYSLDMLKSK